MVRKKSVKLTNHGKKRMRQRSGITSGVSKAMGQRIINYGIRYRDTSGKLRQWIDATIRFSPKTGHMRIYGDSIYILDEDTFITNYRIPADIYANLENCVTATAYALYAHNRNKRKKRKNGGNPVSEEKSPDPNIL